MIHIALWVASALFLGFVGLIILFLIVGVPIAVFNSLFRFKDDQQAKAKAKMVANEAEEYRRGAMRDVIKAHTLPTHKGKPINRN